MAGIGKQLPKYETTYEGGTTNVCTMLSFLVCSFWFYSSTEQTILGVMHAKHWYYSEKKKKNEREKRKKEGPICAHENCVF